MRSVEINLAADPFRNDAPLAAALLALALAAFGFTGWNVYGYLSARSQRASLLQQQAGHRAQMARMVGEAERLKADLQKVDAETLTSQAEFVAGVLEQRNFSWTRLFNSLEEVVPWNNRLVSVRPLFSREGVEVQINGVAQDTQAYLDLQNALLHARQFTRLVPGGYQRQPADQRISFVLGTTYKPEFALPPTSAPAAASGPPAPGAEATGAEPSAPGPDAAAPGPSSAGPAAAPRPATPVPAAAAAPAPAAAGPPNQVTSTPPPVNPPAAAPAPTGPMTPADWRSLRKVKPGAPPQVPTRRTPPTGGEKPAPAGGGGQ